MKRQFPIYFTVILSVIILMSNCKHDINDILVYPKDTSNVIQPPVPTFNNVKDSVCFSEDISPMLVTYCAGSGCHDNITRASGVILNNYQNTISTISGSFLMQVLQDTGANRMPPNASLQLSVWQKGVFQSWINNGMKDGVDCLGDCDTVNVTFSATINPIITSYCVGCHTNLGTNLVGYNSVKTQVDNGKLYCTTFQINGCNAMPQNSSQLPYCKLRQIKKWIDTGAPNN